MVNHAKGKAILILKLVVIESTGDCKKWAIRVIMLQIILISILNLTSLMMINNKHITCGIFYCRDSAEIKGCGSLQTSSWLDSDVLRNRQQKHTAIR